ncbi:tRNA (uracil) methyltransferase [Aspergillus stella-maris]|uniref:tRNA (uracil) methyltransferase n=1 Tax=Aspergillus stella-maris TaxID=1810926 RepID=UPI003CCCB573
MPHPTSHTIRLPNHMPKVLIYFTISPTYAGLGPWGEQAMGRSKKPLRDTNRLTGKPLSETLIPSPVFNTPPSSTPDSASVSNGAETSLERLGEEWLTSPDLSEPNLPYALKDIKDTALFLLENPGFSSSVVFRADILLDIQYQEITGVESAGDGLPGSRVEKRQEDAISPRPARIILGFKLARTIVRRLIPRNAQLDKPLEQTCHVYFGQENHLDAGSHSTRESESSSGLRSGGSRFLIVYSPHVEKEEVLPYYHPQLRALALLYEYEHQQDKDLRPADPDTGPEPGRDMGKGTMSIHILRFRSTIPTSATEIPPRLERTLTNLLEVQIRITKGRLGTPTSKPTTSSPYAPIKDNVIPRARVQDTYSRLKAKYAADLSERWVEATEPSKHVFEDLGVASFLIELWRDMYSVVPRDQIPDGEKANSGLFPGFVDIACGNGVLVYILLSEGYEGWGFDARKRKTWSIFPTHIQDHLKEDIYIPFLFTEALSSTASTSTSTSDSETKTAPGRELHDQLIIDTFIISNHADELTLWTPLLAASLNSKKPNPFIAIPCCSHSLSGARYRYPAQSSTTNIKSTPIPSPRTENENEDAKGDLRALRAQKLASANPTSSSFNTSTYGALTDKLVSLCTELRMDVTRTLLRIPSTRNIGVLGNCSPAPLSAEAERNGDGDKNEILAEVREIVERECARDGGVYLAARQWVERARSLQTKGGSGGGHDHV